MNSPHLLFNLPAQSGRLERGTRYLRIPPPTTADCTLLLLRRIAAAEAVQQPVEALLAAR
ncbi:hypothetical protein [Kitasatospora sp. CB01950]|uniref:hypothetical protein n=1 Tax=Kitasatospora sp. CB01950 TaxID=1703930 RepID=UPI00093A5B97|nr:hypothetical protein [Kitasatospora sp. CB01950]OKI95054.1 hypothetical protein AMK19_32785 [Kitasatospora sp. CB01950]